MSTVFFYGLFMDRDLLEARGLQPERFELAKICDYGLRIGERATIVPAKGERVWGAVMTLTTEELDKLYNREGFADYEPKVLRVILDADGLGLDALCYRLPGDALTGQNPEYASKLADLGERLGLPLEYVREIRKHVTPD